MEEEEEEEEEEDEPPGSPPEQTEFTAEVLADIRAAALASVASLGERDAENRQLGGAWPDYWPELVRSQGPDGEGADVERTVREAANARGRDLSHGIPPDLLVTECRARLAGTIQLWLQSLALERGDASPEALERALAAGLGAEGDVPGGERLPRLAQQGVGLVVTTIGACSLLLLWQRAAQCARSDRLLNEVDPKRPREE